MKKPTFIDDDEGKGKGRKLAEEKSTAADGRKPKIASSDPVFQLIWKGAGKELKRTIFFVNPFPDSESYELLPLKIYTEATRKVSNLGCYKKGEVRARAERAYGVDWASGVSHSDL